MYVHPLTTPIIQPVPQRTLTQWDNRLEHPAPIAGLFGLGGLGLGCADCGGTCCGGNKPNNGVGSLDLSAVFGSMPPQPQAPGLLSSTYSVTSLLLHVAAAYIGYKILKMMFFGEPAKQRRAGIAHAKQRRTRAIAAGNDAVRRARRRPRITMESFD